VQGAEARERRIGVRTFQAAKISDTVHEGHKVALKRGPPFVIRLPHGTSAGGRAIRGQRIGSEQEGNVEVGRKNKEFTAFNQNERYVEKLLQG